ARRRGVQLPQQPLSTLVASTNGPSRAVFSWLIGGALGPYALAAAVHSFYASAPPENPPAQEHNACPAL
ncbi:MAG TPA: hypothetical protein PLY99_07320, partial [Acidovorax temperans]|nr:hypothetical protein [Acidovorax temperans]